MTRPAVLGGEPAFPGKLPLVRPSTARYATPALLEGFAAILREGMLSGVDRHVRAFEEEVASFCAVPHAVALSSCTGGLTLALQHLGARGRTVVLPSFTFIATAHAAYWNGCRVRFADIEPGTLTLDPTAAREVMTDDTAAIVGVHTFGNPCDVDGLARVAEESGCTLLFDAAHALGSRYHGTPAGALGDAAVFSASPTKLLTTMEGGLLTTADGRLADHVRAGRNYGLSDHTCTHPGLSARMPEVSALLGRRMLTDLPEFVRNRNAIARRVRRLLESLPGISFQAIREGCDSSCKDIALLVDPERFGLDREQLITALVAEGIATRRYFSPAVHRTPAYADASRGDLSVTEEVSARVVCLPVHSEMDDAVVERMCEVVRSVHECADEVAAALG